MNEFEARTEALRQALLAGKENEKAEATIARAEVFLAFLKPLAAPNVYTSDLLKQTAEDRRKARKKAAAQAPAAPRKRGRPRKVA